MRLALLALTTVLVGNSFAAPGLPEKKDPAPKKEQAEDAAFVTTAWSDGRAILLNRQLTRLVNQVITMQVVVDGKVQNVNVTVAVPVVEEVTISLDPKTIEVTSADGKAVETADVTKLLKEKTKVIVSPSGKPVGEDLLKQNKNTIVIVVKPTK